MVSVNDQYTQDVELLQSVQSFVPVSMYNPLPLYNKYKNRGIPSGEIAEAIYNGIVDAFMKLDTEKYGHNTFGGFCHLCVLNQIMSLFRSRKHRERSCDPDVFSAVSTNNKHNSGITFQELPELFGVNARRVLFLLTLAVPVSNDYDRLCLDCVYQHFCCGKRWVEVAALYAFNSRQYAQMHGKHGIALIKDYVNSETGSEFCRMLLQDETGLCLDKNFNCNEIYLENTDTEEVLLSTHDINLFDACVSSAC